MLQIGETYREPYRDDIIIITGNWEAGKTYHQLETTFIPRFGFHIGWSVDGTPPEGWVRVEDVSPYPFGKPIWQETHRDEE